MSNVKHPPFSWRYKTRANKCVASIEHDRQGQPWVQFTAENGEFWFFHPDDIDGIVDALKASKAQIEQP
jgi:hypothetical protein